MHSISSVSIRTLLILCAMYPAAHVSRHNSNTYLAFISVQLRFHVVILPEEGLLLLPDAGLQQLHLAVAKAELGALPLRPIEGVVDALQLYLHLVVEQHAIPERPAYFILFYCCPVKPQRA